MPKMSWQQNRQPVCWLADRLVGRQAVWLVGRQTNSEQISRIITVQCDI
jgi:hypothetical protein